MYEATFPKVGDSVTVRVKEVKDIGAYVELLEYNHIEGMIMSSEISRKTRIRSIKSLTQVGKHEVVSVLRVDEEKGYIDLSKRIIQESAKVVAQEKFTKSKNVHGILCHVSAQCKVLTQTLYEMFGWDLYRRFSHAEDGLRQCMVDDHVLDSYALPDNIREVLLRVIHRRFALPAVKLRAEIEVSCFTAEGVDAVIAALQVGKKCSTPAVRIAINLLAPPLYMMTTTATDTTKGLETLTTACDAIRQSISLRKGYFRMHRAPHIVSESDEVQLAKRVAKLERENQEVDGDDEKEEEEEKDDEPEKAETALANTKVDQFVMQLNKDGIASMIPK